MRDLAFATNPIKVELTITQKWLNIKRRESHVGPYHQAEVTTTRGEHSRLKLPLVDSTMIDRKDAVTWVFDLLEYAVPPTLVYICSTHQVTAFQVLLEEEGWDFSNILLSLTVQDKKSNANHLVRNSLPIS